jgi:copper chaperone
MSSTIEKVTLTAPDISCGHCVATINKAVGGLDGVQQVEAEEATKQVHISYDPAKVTLAQIEATMEEEGYPVQK